MPKVTLTDRFITSAKIKPEDGRRDFADSLVPGLALRVTSSGHRSFVLIARFPKSRPHILGDPWHPTRRALGDYGAITIEEAREKARVWLSLLQKGLDPKIEHAKVVAEAQRRRVVTFASVADAFLERHASGLRKAAEARRIVGAEFVSRWGSRPIGDIRAEEAAAAIRAIVQRDAPYQAHNALGYLRRLFSWAIGTHEFGIEVSPIERLKPRDLIGRREARERILTDTELRAVWDAAIPMGYPYGPLIRMLILTGQREREVGDGTWAEIDLDQRLWTIPAARMKGGRPHDVPLSELALALLEALPRFTAGDCLFTTTDGRVPVSGYSAAKRRIDGLSGVTGWKFHDLRRTVRTHLSALPMEDVVREAVIAHAKKGLHRVYDQHAYLAEKRECLALWEARLAGIVKPISP